MRRSFTGRLISLSFERILSILLFSALWTGGGQTLAATRLDPILNRDLSNLEAYHTNPTPIGALRLKAAGFPLSGDPVLRVFVYTPVVSDDGFLGKLGKLGLRVFPHTYLPPVGNHPFGYYLAEGRASDISILASSGYLPRMTAAYRKLKPLNDLTARETGAAEARTWDPPLTGAGVRLAILDSGFRFEHPDLPDAAVECDYSLYPDTSRDATDHVSGHGTHVAGTAFGNGSASGGRWRGMAPGITPIYFKIGDDTTGDATSEAVVGALRGAATWADADIASMSYGGWDGFCDGSSAEEQAVDWAVGQGVTVFMSAGNDATDSTHFSGLIDGGATSEPIMVRVRHATENSTWGFALTFFDGPDTSVHLPLDLEVVDAEQNPVLIDPISQLSSPRGTEYIEWQAREVLPVDTSTFYLRVTNFSEERLRFHIWIISSHWYVRFPQADQGYSVLSPSTADSCISVGAYATRNTWTDYLGNLDRDRAPIGEIASFSSLGPRIDEHLKPDITAPGRRTVSCRDTFNVRLGSGIDYLILSNNGDRGLPADYVAYMGTSMSSPAAAGSAALILEESNDLNPAQLRALIFRTARRDEFTGRVPNSIWGWGKIDVVRALDMTDEIGSSGEAPVEFAIASAFPNPANSELTVLYKVVEAGDLTISVADGLGREVWSKQLAEVQAGESRLAIPISTIAASGSYILTISRGDARRSYRLALVK